MVEKSLIYIIKFYRKFISPSLPGKCRFYPSCSSYGIQAISKYGPIKGGYLAVKRILRCHPWSEGGHDPLE